MRLFKRHPLVPVLRFSGPIGMAMPLKPGLSLATSAAAIERAFTISKCKSVALLINSPGGSAVQSRLIFARIRALAKENEKKVYAFCEDAAASGGYMLACAGDEIYADPSSIVGSIGVISSGFGLDKAIEKFGIERRVYTAGTNKGALDPFLPERADDIERLKAMQRGVHEVFSSLVRERRGARLKDDPDLFTGAFWAGADAVQLGLVDGLADLRGKMQELHGEDVRLRVVPMEGGGWLSRRLRRLPGMGRTAALAPHSALNWADELISAVEARALWSRIGL